MRLPNLIQSRQASDYTAVAVAISIPWSTSATAGLMFLWLAVFLPTINVNDIRREIFTLAGGLPVVLCVWAIFGAAWTDASWAEAFASLRQFLKLLFIPVVLAYFRRSGAGPLVMACFIASCIAVLFLSLVAAAWPDFELWRLKDRGVPVKSYITQTAEFAIATFFLIYAATAAWREKAYFLAGCAAVLILIFVGDILFIVTSRTGLVALAVLALTFGFRFHGWKGGFAALVAFAAIALLAWNTSGYLRERIQDTERDIQTYRTDASAPATSTSYRLEFLKKSVGFVAAAPVFGHGTGSTSLLFRQASQGQTGVAAAVTPNPHNQLLAVAIQLGAIGGLMLCAMWLAHIRLFLESGAAAWLGLTIVVQNIIGSMFNTHLFDFTEGWLYVCGVGVLGGTVLRRSVAGSDDRAPRRRFRLTW